MVHEHLAPQSLVAETTGLCILNSHPHPPLRRSPFPCLGKAGNLHRRLGALWGWSVQTGLFFRVTTRSCLQLLTPPTKALGLCVRGGCVPPHPSMPQRALTPSPSQGEGFSVRFLTGMVDFRLVCANGIVSGRTHRSAPTNRIVVRAIVFAKASPKPL